MHCKQAINEKLFKNRIMGFYIGRIQKTVNFAANCVYVFHAKLMEIPNVSTLRDH